MLANERKNRICEIIKEKGAVTTSYLVGLFGVSIETVRKDLLDLEKSGQLTRVHGGAVSKTGVKKYYDLETRNKEYSKEKKELSEETCKFIKDGDVIAIDTGSTAIILAETIKEKFKNLTVVTHSVDVFNILSDVEGFTLILLGGNYMRSENCFSGRLCLDMLNKIHVEKCFIFPFSVSLDFGIGDYSSDLSLVQTAIVASSEEVFVLADSSKFEKKALLKLDDMKKEYTYVTDSALSDELLNIYTENGLNVVRKDGK